MWTPSHPLYGAQLRFERADHHLAEADRLIDAFSLACIDHVVSDDHHQTIRIEKFPPVPIELPLVVSDVIHNLRAALDYIVYELALKDSGTIQDGTQFLIHDSKTDDPITHQRGFDTRSKQCLKGLNQTHIDMIEAFQPYMGVQWTKTLRDISNPDKHRTLTAITHHGRRLTVEIQWHPDGRFRGAEKMTLQGITYDRYNLKFDAYDTIAIAGAKAGEPALMHMLRDLEAAVSSAIELFKPEFPI